MSEGGTPRRVAILSTYPPRACGIATYTRDLRAALTAPRDPSPEVIAVDEPGAGRGYGPEVRGRLAQDDRAAYRRLAADLNAGDVDVLCVQHEYGLYGGPRGAMLLELLAAVRIPVVLTLHTVLPDPDSTLRDLTRALCQHSTAVVVPARAAVGILRGAYGVDPAKLTVIPHGAPDAPDRGRLGGRDVILRRLRLSGRRVVTTFGLLGPNKGIEVALRALPAVVASRPDVRYLVLGATHPGERRRAGEGYRRMLEATVAAAGLRDHVRFVDRYLDDEELTAWLAGTDVCLLPYLEGRQVSSGTLVRALAAGAPVVATEFPAARELLESGGGGMRFAA